MGTVVFSLTLMSSFNSLLILKVFTYEFYSYLKKKNISLLKKGFGFLQMVEVFKHTHL